MVDQSSERIFRMKNVHGQFTQFTQAEGRGRGTDSDRHTNLETSPRLVPRKRARDTSGPKNKLGVRRARQTHTSWAGTSRDRGMIHLGMP